MGKFRAIKFSPSQVEILKALAESKHGLTIAQLIEKGLTVTTQTLGPTYRETLESGKYPDCLYALGYVRPQLLEDEPVRWVITPEGKQIAATLRSRRHTDKGNVDLPTLDSIVMRFRPLRSYGLEQYTDVDLTEIRKQLPTEQRNISLSDLRNLITNRRKQGAYTDPTAKRVRTVKATLSALGDSGWLLPGFLTPDQVSALQSILSDPS